MKINSKYVLRYVTSWFEEDSFSSNYGFYIQSEDGMTLSELLNQRNLTGSEVLYIFC